MVDIFSSTYSFRMCSSSLLTSDKNSIHPLNDNLFCKISSNIFRLITPLYFCFCQNLIDGVTHIHIKCESYFSKVAN